MHSGDVFDSPVRAVLPAVAFRSLFLGVVLAAFAAVLFFIAPVRITGFFASAGVDANPLVVSVGGAFAFGFLVPVALSVAHYSNRRYVLTDDSVVEYKCVAGSKNEVDYEELEDVHLTRSLLQRVLGVGTVRVNDIDDEDDSRVQEKMRLRYVEEPETVYERLREESGGSSSSPVDVVQPIPKAVLPGALLGSFFLFLFAAIPMGLVVVGAGAFLGLTLTEMALAFVGLAVVFVGGITYYSYSVYDTLRYEVYDDRIEIEAGSSYTAVPYDDVAEVETDDDSGSVGEISLKDDEGEELGSLEYVRNANGLADRIRGYVERDEESSGW